jgi:hypothetical protein
MLIVVAVLVGWVYQAVCSAREKRDYPPPGQLIDVGGYRLHLFCIGKGGPTVVLHWAYSLAWYSVQPEIAKFTRVCAIDPAGLPFRVRIEVGQLWVAPDRLSGKICNAIMIDAPLRVAGVSHHSTLQ